MPRSYRQISQYEKEIIESYNQGMTLRAIAEKLGFTHKQVQEFKTRYNKKQRMIEAGQAIHKKGRPCKIKMVDYHHQFRIWISLRKCDM